MMRKLAQLFLLLGCVARLLACGGVKLTDVPSSTVALKLSTEQRKFIEPKIEFINDIVEDYDFEKAELKTVYERYQTKASLPRLSRHEGGGRITRRKIFHGQRELRTEIRNFVKQRQEYAKEIGDLVDEIRANLSPQQLGLFEEIALPKLKLPKILRKHHYDNFMFIPGTQMASPDNF